jgi:hypothetical protein
VGRRAQKRQHPLTGGGRMENETRTVNLETLQKTWTKLLMLSCVYSAEIKRYKEHGMGTESRESMLKEIETLMSELEVVIYKKDQK